MHFAGVLVIRQKRQLHIYSYSNSCIYSYIAIAKGDKMIAVVLKINRTGNHSYTCYVLETDSCACISSA